MPKRSGERTNSQETTDEFDKLLVTTIDEIIRRIVGDENALFIYEHLEKTSCPLQEIPKKLSLFSKALRDLLGTSEGQVLAPVMEDAIVEDLSLELGLRSDGKSGVFEDRIKRLKAQYDNGKDKKAQG